MVARAFTPVEYANLHIKKKNWQRNVKYGVGSIKAVTSRLLERQCN